ncbi:hypothetical protein NDU88_005699 [Pleurodeles waltl]|uniref:Uncharacterized protein n=1 Tax=Pleurodeles waltl TaxID=8319 RepID=A0AAV7QJS8_PLEWA|nr:hypothetical protein NDU88_005699 [Pleurodeles waltl]
MSAASCAYRPLHLLAASRHSVLYRTCRLLHSGSGGRRLLLPVTRYTLETLKISAGVLGFPGSGKGEREKGLKPIVHWTGKGVFLAWKQGVLSMRDRGAVRARAAALRRCCGAEAVLRG